MLTTKSNELYCSNCMHEFGEDEIVYEVDNSYLCTKCFVEDVFRAHSTALDDGLRLCVRMSDYAMMDL